MDKDREGILKGFLKTIFEISDKEYQKRIWLKGLGPECSDFDEAICNFFDDGEDIIKNYKNYKISEDQFKKVIILHNELKKYVIRFLLLVMIKKYFLILNGMKLEKLLKKL